jgi:hypothetical protein
VSGTKRELRFKPGCLRVTAQKPFETRQPVIDGGMQRTKKIHLNIARGDDTLLTPRLDRDDAGRHK